ncbi:MAG: branched-chain amino acid ABC transporter permease [Solirubrobacteraceae bacterium]|nr:branched-chain amino acid ABC transporter permease [Solirubrobacteraceae bacterium]
MQRFLDLTLDGLASGAIYAAVALSLVMIWRATRILNFAQAGMLMLTTFIAWSILDAGGGYWLAFAAALASGFLLGAVVERVVIRPVEGAPPLNAVIVTLGLLVVLQAGAGMVWGNQPESFPAAFSIQGFELFGHTVPFSRADLFAVIAVAIVLVLLVVLFRRTSIGLQMRAAALAPDVSKLLGVRVGRMFTLGWGLAAMVGALAGVLVAPSVFVSPSSFDAILVFGFTAAVVGGLESPPGAVVGGILVGLALSYMSGYFGSSTVTLGALGILVAVLMIRPNGLFATSHTRHV